MHLLWCQTYAIAEKTNMEDAVGFGHGVSLGRDSTFLKKSILADSEPWGVTSKSEGSAHLSGEEGEKCSDNSDN